MTNRERTKSKLAAFARRPVAELDGATELADLVADSLDLAELVIVLQEDLGVRLGQAELGRLRTVDDLLGAVDRCGSKGTAPRP